jgi:hypothetical protein
MNARISSLRCLSVLISVACCVTEPAAQTPGARGLPGHVTIGATPCTPVGDIRFLCYMASPEDLAVVPGAEWVIASGNRETGRLHLISVRQKTSTILFPTPAPRERLDRKAYPGCPGPLDLKNPDAFRAHGLYLEPGQNGAHTLLVVHHGTRESIEVFELNVTATPPALTWTGCAVAPPKFSFNSVVALPGGGFAATNSSAGDVWQYQAATGWTQVPGSEGTAANGLEISRDGQWLFINGWAEEKLTRLSRNQTPVRKDVIKLGFRPDNIRMSADGSVLFAAGHTDKDGKSISGPRDPLSESSNVARIDPQSLEFRRIFQHANIPGFVATTTAIQIGNELWLGAQRGDRVAYLPMPK